MHIAYLDWAFAVQLLAGLGQFLHTILKWREDKFHGQDGMLMVHQIVGNVFLIAAIYASALVSVFCIHVYNLKVINVDIHPITI